MKKFLAITLALVMTFAMVACGGTSSSTPASTPASGTGAAEPAAEGGGIPQRRDRNRLPAGYHRRHFGARHVRSGRRPGSC